MIRSCFGGLTCVVNLNIMEYGVYWFIVVSPVWVSAAVDLPIEMTRGKRRTAWLAIVLYATTVCTGQGLHLLPRCGHAVQLPSGRLSSVASAGHRHASECSHDDGRRHSGPSRFGPRCRPLPDLPACLLPVYGGSTANPVSAELLLYNTICFSNRESLTTSARLFLAALRRQSKLPQDTRRTSLHRLGRDCNLHCVNARRVLRSADRGPPDLASRPHR